MKKIFTMLLALSLLNLNYSCSDDENTIIDQNSQVSNSQDLSVFYKSLPKIDKKYIENIGDPLLDDAWHYRTEDNETLVLIPLQSRTEKAINGFIERYIDKDNKVQFFVKTKSGDLEKDFMYTYYENRLFNNYRVSFTTEDFRKAQGLSYKKDTDLISARWDDDFSWGDGCGDPANPCPIGGVTVTPGNGSSDSGGTDSSNGSPTGGTHNGSTGTGDSNNTGGGASTGSTGTGDGNLPPNFSSNLIELNELLEQDPLVLLEINCNQIKKWQSLTQHKAPQSVINKINNLPSSWANDFELQDISNANGTVVNMDYFAVNVTQLPINPTTKKRFTAPEFLQHFRKNINQFVDTEKGEFEPYCKNVSPSICSQETNLWNSNNPLGSLVYIDINPDDGVVVMTEYATNHWNFMTMNAPYAGNHPVSGTRQFGYESNGNGGYNFYVRGVDRFDSNFMENGAWVASIVSDEKFNSFFGADELWKSFQNKMNGFINQNGGKSSIINAFDKNNKTVNRPDWNKIKDVLYGKKPISDLGCK